MSRKYLIPWIVGLLIGTFLCQPGYAVVATGTGGGTTLTDSASLAAALSDETGTGAAVFGTSPTITSATINGGTNASAITSSGYSLTGSNAQPLLDLSGTWNTSGTPTGIKLNITDTNSNANSLLMDLQTGGTTRLSVSRQGNLTASGSTITAYAFQAQNIIRIGNGTIAEISSPISDTIEQRRSTNPQTFNIYNTYTSGTNNELYRTQWSSNVCYTGAKAGSGGGSNRLEVHHGGAEKTLTDNSATAFVTITCPSDDYVGGCIHYTITANDGADHQARSGTLPFSIIKSGTNCTPTVGTPNESVAVSTGTLTNTFTVSGSGTTATFSAQANSSLDDVVVIRYRVEIFGPQATVTPQ